MKVQPITREERDDVRALLAANDLPTDDLDDPAVTLFAARRDGELVGVIGLQTCERAGLLRSLAVATSARNRGVGARLCRHVVETALARGLAELYLMTTSAADYFSQHGFAAIDRSAVPAAVRASAQFASLCPSSATVMRRIS